MPLPLANPSAPSQTCAKASAPIPHAPLHAPALIRYWHLASLDAPTVAIAWSLAFAWAAAVHLPAWVPLLLALGTFTVYIGDRLLDARAALRSGAVHTLRDRHFFHWRHRRLLATLAGLSAIAAAALLFTLVPVVTRERDSVLAAAALAYFSGVHSRRPMPTRLATLHSAVPLSKEMLVGLLFTTGCVLPVFSRLHANVALSSRLWPLLSAALFFAAIAWLNCHAIDRWETATPSRIIAAASLLALAGLSLAFALASAQPRLAALFIAGSASALLLALLHRSRTRLTPLALRAAADLALLTPLLLLAR